MIVTGHGRSGTHWLAHVLGHFVQAHHEPADYEQCEGIIVDCRLHNRIPRLLEQGHEVLHLVRDGRDVVRSTYEWARGARPFEELCAHWADVVDACEALPVVRFEDLTRAQAASGAYRMTHWTEWPDDMTEAFWRHCGAQMRRYGYAA